MCLSKNIKSNKIYLQNKRYQHQKITIWYIRLELHGLNKFDDGNASQKHFFSFLQFIYT